MFLNNLKHHEFRFVKVLICSITIALLLGGCGGYRWVNSEKNISHFDKDSTQCQAYAFEKFPPNIIQQLQYKPVYNPQAVILARQAAMIGANPHSDPLVASAHGFNEGLNDIQNAPMAYQSVTIDLNKNAQDAAFKKCMYQKGWVLKY